jgi:hypothetical protein
MGDSVHLVQRPLHRFPHLGHGEAVAVGGNLFGRWAGTAPLSVFLDEELSDQDYIFVGQHLQQTLVGLVPPKAPLPPARGRRKSLSNLWIQLAQRPNIAWCQRDFAAGTAPILSTTALGSAASNLMRYRGLSSSVVSPAMSRMSSRSFTHACIRALSGVRNDGGLDVTTAPVESA